MDSPANRTADWAPPSEKPINQADYGTTRPDSASGGSIEAQDGVKRIEAVSMTWSKWGLVVAYLSVFLMACSTSLEGQVSYNFTPFVTSSFSTHSLIATVYVVQGVVNAVIKPPMAKIADVFGRLEAYSLSVLLYVLGYIQMAASQNVQTYAAAQIFYSAGFTGTQILQQIFIADTSDLRNRALFSSLPDIPFLATVWIGPLVASAILNNSTWRWGYGMWAIILPAMFLPLALTLFINDRKSKREGLTPPRHARAGSLTGLKNLFFDLDVGGIVLLSAAFALILIPMTLAATTEGGWSSGKIIAMIVLGFVFLIAFPIWEASPTLAPHPLIPLNLLRSRTFSAGIAIGFFYFMVFYLSVQPYFYSYLLVVQNQGVTAAGHITQVFSFTSTVAAVSVSIIIKYTRHYKYFVVAGSCIYLMGIGLMIRYRTQDASVGQLVGTQIAVGIGGGMLNVPAQLGVQASASHQQVAAATAVFLTLVEIGGAVGAAISGAVWGHLVPAKLQEYLPEAAKANASSIYASVVTASSYAVGSPERDAINRAYQETMTTLLTIAVCLCAPIVLLGFVMSDYKLDEMDQKVKGLVVGGEVDAGERPAESNGRRWKLNGRGWFNKGRRAEQPLDN